MLFASAWVTLAASIVPKSLPQPTRPAISHRGAASSMFLPLTGARQSSSAELSSSQKQLSQQLAHSASGSTLSLNLDGCASHRACTRMLHTHNACLYARCRSTLSSSLHSVLCSSLSALRTPLSPLTARRALRSALCALRSAHAARRTPHAARRTLRRTPHAARRTLRAARHAPHAARHRLHATGYTPQAARHAPHATRRTPRAARHAPQAARHRLHATRRTPTPS